MTYAPPIIPSIDAINSATTWQTVYELCGLNTRNTRAHKPIQQYVLTNYPECPALKPRRNYVNDDFFADIISSSVSARQVIERVGWKMGGGSYTMLYDRVQRLGLDTSHFVGQAYLKGKTHDFNTKPIDTYLVDGRETRSHSLKMRLIKDGLKQHRCEECNNTEWNGQPIPIALDHVNGDKLDNRLENLRILCPNCHAQTPTFAGKNIGKTRRSGGR